MQRIHQQSETSAEDRLEQPEQHHRDTVRKYQRFYMREWRKRNKVRVLGLRRLQYFEDKLRRSGIPRERTVRIREILAYGRAKGLPCIITPEELRAFFSREVC